MNANRDTGVAISVDTGQNYDGFLLKRGDHYCVILRNEKGLYDRARELPKLAVWSDSENNWVPAESSRALEEAQEGREAPAKELGGHAQQWVRDLLFSAHFCGSSNHHAGELRRMLAPNADIAEEVIRRESHRNERYNEALLAAPADHLPAANGPDGRLQLPANSIKHLGLEIFDGPECPQSVRDAIEWFAAELSVSQLPPADAAVLDTQREEGK